ncbi:MAG: hypothetical protein U0K23_02870 [Selenomonadaceae bacterium]|nr:hypothetical protein [Selenomonadaceae bacterium]
MAENKIKTVSNVDWHSGFYGAIGLEFIENDDDITLIDEHRLNHQPIRIDLLVVKKNREIQIANELGAAFRGHNIMEYKSEDDILSIDTVFKANAYASLYKAYGKHVDDIKADDITVTLCRITYPRDVFKALKNYGYAIEQIHQGIYMVTGKFIFPTQIVVMKQLDPELHFWLSNLRKDIPEPTFRDVIIRMHGFTTKQERAYAKAYFGALAEYNKQLHVKAKEDSIMNEYMREFYKEELEINYSEGKAEGKAEERIKSARDIIKAGLTTLEKLKNSGLYSAEELSAIASL